MKDAKVTVIRTNLPISLPIRKVKDAPLTLEVRGSHFNRAKAVYINETEVTTYTVVSAQLIVVEVPPLIRQKDIRQIQVVSENPIINKKNLIHFEMGNAIRSVSGFERLIQHFIKVLLQSPGSNAFRQGEGGGLLKLIGQNTITDGIPITTDIIDGINRTKAAIISRQNKLRNIPLNERLLNVNINGVSFGKDKTTVEVSITLTNMAGTSISTGIVL